MVCRSKPGAGLDKMAILVQSERTGQKPGQIVRSGKYSRQVGTERHEIILVRMFKTNELVEWRTVSLQVCDTKTISK